MKELLVSAGLSDLQAEVYLYLLEHGEAAPPILTEHIDITRSNAYKILETLEEVGLASKTEVKNKFVYRAADPSALANLVAIKRNNVIALESHVNAAMQELRSTYIKSTQITGSVECLEGKEAMIDAYMHQNALEEPIYFVKSRSDVPYLGYETMSEIRQQPARYKTRRFGITQDSFDASPNLVDDAKSNLTRTWIEESSYTAPVEWTVSGDELLIQVFMGEGRVIKIQDQEVANSFKELWSLTDNALRSAPGYKKLPTQASRPSE